MTHTQTVGRTSRVSRSGVACLLGGIGLFVLGGCSADPQPTTATPPSVQTASVAPTVAASPTLPPPTATTEGQPMGENANEPILLGTTLPPLVYGEHSVTLVDVTDGAVTLRALDADHQLQVGQSVKLPGIGELTLLETFPESTDADSGPISGGGATAAFTFQPAS